MTAPILMKTAKPITQPGENRMAVSGWILLGHLMLLGLLIALPQGARVEPPDPAPMVMVELETPPIPLAAGQTSAPVNPSVTAASPVAKLTTMQSEGAHNEIQSTAPAKSPVRGGEPTPAVQPHAVSSPNSSTEGAIASVASTASATAISAQSVASSGAQRGGDAGEGASRSIASAAPTSVSGSDFSAPQFGAGYLSNPAPDYPTIARRLGEEGKVLLHVLVTPEGAAKQVQLHRSSGSDSLDGAALKAVRKWRFVPARRGEQAVEAWVYVPIVFKLD